jgi:hypothetical protein
VKESLRLVAEYEKLFDGSSWIDVNIMDTLKPLSAIQASSKPFRNANSIWQIVNHLVSWREAILKRLKDEAVAAPANNFFEPVKILPKPPGEKHWTASSSHRLPGWKPSMPPTMSGWKNMEARHAITL